MLVSPATRSSFERLAPLLLPAVAGFALGRITAPPSAPLTFGYDAYAGADPYALGYARRSPLVSTIATLGGFAVGSHLGRSLAHGRLGCGLDRSAFGGWYAHSIFGSLTGRRASGLLGPLTGLTGALIGNWLAG